MIEPFQRRLMRGFDAEAILRAIEEVESKSSAEVRVSVAPFFAGDVNRVARRAFARMGMTDTKERNGVLIFVVPSRREFAIVGDEGIHAKVGQQYWDDLAAATSARFAAGDWSDAVVRGIQDVGACLAAHFPPDSAGDRDELPNAIDIKEAARGGE